MLLDNKHLGQTVILPEGEVVAGEMGTWELTYTVGKYGIDDRASLIFAWRNQSDWQLPQFDNPKGEGYSVISTTGDARVKAENTVWRRPFINSVLVKVSEGFLKEGDVVKLVLGDTSKGSLGIRAQSFPEARHHFKTMVDPFGTRRYEEVPGDVTVKIVPAQASEIQAVAPSILSANEKFELLVRAMDQNGNPTSAYNGSVKMELFSRGEKKADLGAVSFDVKDDGFKRAGNLKIETPGEYIVKVSDDENKMLAYSNAIMVSEAVEEKLWWADMHGQTKHTIGSGSLDDYFSFARDKSGLDVTGWQGNDFQITENTWKEVREKSHEYNEPGKFCTFLGYEWSGTTPNGGDHNIYFKGDSEEFYPSSNWLEYEGKMNKVHNAVDMNQFFDLCKDRDDVMAIPHIGGRRGNLDYRNEKYGSLIEVHSHHGTSEWFIHDAMEKRLKVGFVGASDDHTCRQGLSYPLIPKNERASTFDVKSGFTGIYSKELTRESIWEALMSRRCYATTFTRMLLDVKIDDNMMGSEITMDQVPEVKINVNSNAPIENIKVYNWNELIHDETFLKKDKKKIRISWKGVRARNRKRAAKWDGTLHIKGGKFVNPTEYAFDRADQGITKAIDNMINWTSSTSGDVDGIITEISCDENAELSFTSQFTSFIIKVDEIKDEPLVFNAGGENLQVEVSLANETLDDKAYLDSCNVSIAVKDSNVSEGMNAYWVRVFQEDSNIAWSSPIYVDFKS